MARVKDKQVRIPAPVQKRRKTPEDGELWNAIKALRLAGHSVYRGGTGHHMVDGRRRTDSWIFARRSEIDQLAAVKERKGPRGAGSRKALNDDGKPTGPAMGQASLFR